jgi:hypothetical protein
VNTFYRTRRTTMKALMLGVLLAATAVVGAGVETAWA